VNLGDSDIGSTFDGPEYDAWMRLLTTIDAAGGGRPSMDAMTSMLDWVDTTINRPLLERNEKDRWDAIVDAQIIRVGDNLYTETIAFPNPTGNRVNAGGVWSNNSYDPYLDIMAGMDFLAGKGFTVNRIIAPQTVITKLANNALIRQRVGRLSLTGGTITGLAGRASREAINGLLSEDGLPPIERYDSQYRTSTSSGYFLKRDVFILVATTGRDIELDLADTAPMPLFNTLGYTGIGTPAGQPTPGRVAFVRHIPDTKPPRLEGEGWQTSLPVVLNPDAIYVIKNIT
jgi:hypothetical protein